MRRTLALDDPAFQKPLNHIGKGGAVDSRETHKVGLAEPFMLRNRGNDRILPGGEIEIPGLLREYLRSALACAVKKVNDRPVNGVSAAVRRLLSSAACLA